MTYQIIHSSHNNAQRPTTLVVFATEDNKVVTCTVTDRYDDGAEIDSTGYASAKDGCWSGGERFITDEMRKEALQVHATWCRYSLPRA